MSWTFITNHARVFLHVAQGGNPRLRDIADAIGLTERAVHSIVTDLVDDGYLSRTKEGRRNLYSVNDKRPMRVPELRNVEVGDLLDALIGKKRPKGAKRAK